jgi:hypothetical protein
MRTFDPAQAALRSGSSGVEARHLLWLTARHRGSGLLQSLGLWTGDDHRSIAIGGVSRDWYGAGTLLEIEPIRAGIGIEVRLQRVTLSPLADEVAGLIGLYDLRLAPVTIHEVLLDPLTGLIAGEPARLFRGWVNALDITTGRIGGEAAATLTLASAARALTRTLPAWRSDAAMRLRDPGDGFRRYTDIAGEVGVWWGEKRA